MPESYHVFSGLKNTLSKQQKRTRRRVWTVSATKLLEGKLHYGMEGAPTTVLAEVRWQNATPASLSSLREENHLLLMLDFSEEWPHPPPTT